MNNSKSRSANLKGVSQAVFGLRTSRFLLIAALAIIATGLLLALSVSAQSEDEPLTASFLADTGPSNHAGDGQIFTIRIRFSEDIDTGYAVLRDDALEVEGGTARKFKRVDGSSSLWEIHVEPDSDAAMTLTLPATTNCAAADAVCTASDKPLSQSAATTIPGPAPEPTPTPTPTATPTPTPEPTPEPTGEAPDEPTGLEASAASGVGATLVWDDPADDGITGYEVLRRDLAVHEAGHFETIESDTGSAATTYTDATVEAGGGYVYRVKAINANGVSVRSGYARIDVPEDYEPPEPEATGGNAPSGLTAELVNADVSLSWQAPAEDADSVTGYQVSRRWTDPDDANIVHADLFITGGAATTWVDDAIPQSSVTFSYRVQADRDGETSGWSNEAQVEYPAPEPVATGDTVTPPDEPVALAQVGGWPMITEREVVEIFWEGTLTVGDSGGNRGYSSSSNYGSLSPTVVSLNGREYTILRAIYEGVGTPNFTLYVSERFESDFILHLDNKQLSVAEGTFYANFKAYSWGSPGLNWAIGQSVQMRLQHPPRFLPPVSVANVTRTTAQVTVNAPGRDGETVYMQYGSGDWSPTQQRTVTDGSAVFDLTGLAASTRYAVRASLDRTLPYRDWISVRPTQEGEVVVLHTIGFETEWSLRHGPSSVSAKPTGNGGYELSWTEPNWGERITGYRIVRILGNNPWPTVMQAEITGSDTLTYTDPGPLPSGHRYYYLVWALNADGASRERAEVLVNTRASDGFTAAPSAPHNVRQDRNAPDGQLKLIWDAPEDGSATSYVVVMHEIGDHLPGGSWRPMEMGTVTSTSFIHHLTADHFPREGEDVIYRSYQVYSLNADGLRSRWPGQGPPWQGPPGLGTHPGPYQVMVPFRAPGCETCTYHVRPPR